jgi:putative nucleotidyltransferase with HDIG domain
MIQLKDKFKFLKSWEKYTVGNIPLSEVLVKLSFALSLIIIIPLMFPSGRSFKYTDLIQGSIATKKVIAPFNFTVLKTDDELEKDRNEAEDKVAYYFELNDTTSTEQTYQFKEFLNLMEITSKKISGILSSTPASVNKDSTITDSLSLQSIQKRIQSQFGISVKTENIQRMISVINKGNFTPIKRQLLTVFSDLNTINYIDLNKDEIINGKVILIKNGIEEDIPLTSLVDGSDVKTILNTKYSKLQEKDILLPLVENFWLPNVQYLKELTEQRRKDEVALVSLGKDMVLANERIVDANERITEEIHQKLFSLERTTAERSEEQGDLRNILSQFGKYLLTALILVLYILYLSANRPKILRDNKKLLLITILIFLQVSVGALILGPLGWPLYVVPTTISSMLLGILFDPGIGLVGTVVIGLLLAGITGFDYSFAILTMFVGIVAIYSISHIRTRNQIFKAILYILTAYVIIVFTLGTLKYQEFNEVLKIFVYFLLPNAILSPLVTYMILGVFERLFDITTDISLLELSDLNRPLLKELSIKAPGTFHHSIIVGNLSESAAIAIGANSLMARVGSYYHDIGKMVKPEYFVENQKDKVNKHESLAPNMSAIILASHVKNGLDMAEKKGLPKIIRDFIPEHHGRNLMGYFYNKAIEDVDVKDVNESDYRYPGPSPRSKETAIVMLADTIEAASRTLKNPSAGRLRKQVEELVEKRFLEGELDDSDLTMRDLKGIIDGFMSVLLGIFHQRIEYPKSEENKKSGNQNGIRKEKALRKANNGNSGTQ